MGYFSRRGVYPHPCREQPCSIRIASSDKGSAPSKPTRHVTSALRFIVKCSLEQRAVVIYPFDVLPLEPITKRAEGEKRLLNIPFRAESYPTSWGVLKTIISVYRLSNIWKRQAAPHACRLLTLLVGKLRGAKQADVTYRWKIKHNKI